MKKFTLYVGLNDGQTKEQVIGTDEALEIVNALLLEEYDLSGATIQHGCGVYKHHDGTIIKENTVIIILLGIDDSIINEIIDDLKVIFRQESILKEVCFVDCTFL